MSQVKISDLTATTSATGTDVLAGVQGDTTKKFEVEQVLMSRAINDTRFKTFRVSPLAAKVVGGKIPDFVKFTDNGSGSFGVYSYRFSHTTEEELYFDMAAPCDWKEGTTIYLQIAWAPISNGSAGQTVCWGLEDAVCERGAVFGNSTLFYTDVSIPSETLVAKKHYYSEISITTAGETIRNVNLTRIFRDATGVGGTDSYADDVALLDIAIIYEVDGFGSATKDAK